MPTMKYVMSIVLIATAMLAAPAGHADPDPHQPDVGANYCPGGAGVGDPSPEPCCDGVPYPDGSYWHAIQRGASGTSFSWWCSASCPLRRQVPSPVLCRKCTGRYRHRQAAASRGRNSVCPRVDSDRDHMLQVHQRR